MVYLFHYAVEMALKARVYCCNLQLLVVKLWTETYLKGHGIMDRGLTFLVNKVGFNPAQS